MIHICFSDGFKNTIEDFDSELDVISLPLIFNIGSVEEIEEMTIYKMLFFYNMFEEIDKKKALKNFYSILSNTEKDSFTIWYSEDSNEYCGMLYTVYKLNEYFKKDIYLVNCTQKIYRDNCIVSYSWTGEIQSVYLPLFFDKIKQIDDKLDAVYRKEFIENFCTPKMIRIYANDRVEFVERDILTNMIYPLISTGKSHGFHISKIKFELNLNFYIVDYIISFLAKENKISINEKGIIVK